MAIFLANGDVEQLISMRDCIAVAGSDIVVVATNSNEPVFEVSWLEPGHFVSFIVNVRSSWSDHGNFLI